VTTFAAQISAAERRYSNTAARRYKNEELIGKGAPFLADTPERVRLWFRRRGLPTDLAERAIKTGNVSLEAQESMAPVGRTEPVALERVLGTTDFLGVAFLERGLQVARTVARIAIRGKTGSPIGYGTGFMVSPRLLMTNNHVLPDAQLAADSIAEFDYFVRADGTPSTVKVFGLEPQTFFCTDETLDFALVAVSEVGANGDALYPIGWNQLIPEEGKAIIGQWVNVIQHPNGEPKQLVLRNNQIVDTPDQFLTYVADTSPGSSGSPVYNDQWEVVALHHAGVPARDAQGRILNLQGQPWQDWMGEHQVKWLANEGARVSRLVAHLNALALTASERALFLQALQRPPAPTPRNETAPTRASTALNAFDPPAVASDGAATWTIPLRITLSLGELGRPSATAVAPPAGGNIIVPAARDGMPRAVPSSEQGILEAARNEFLKRPGVLGVRLGYRFVDDWITTERAIVVTVDSKKSLFELQRTGQSALPQSFNGYQVQVTGPTLRELIAGASGSANEALALPVTLRPEEITYVGADVPLATVNERMKIKLHMSPDAGWPHLKKFLGGTKERLVVGMYDFGAEHILDAILAKPRLKELVLVMQRGESLGKGKGAKKDDLPDADVAQALSDKFGKRFHFGWVRLGVKNGWVANSYHIKVAVRDSSAFWLSSGNWQSSNQPPVNLAGSNDLSFLTKYNREWHAIVEHEGLAKVYEAYLRNDLAKGASPDFTEAIAELPNVLVPVLEAVSLGPNAHYFDPLELDEQIQVTPLLTPDNYLDAVLKMVKSAKKEILLQNQTFNAPNEKQDKLAELLDVLQDKQAKIPVKIIFRLFMPADARRNLEQLVEMGFDVDSIRVQPNCHTKGIIVDGRLALLGSHNVSASGITLNRDASLLFAHEGIADYLRRAFLHDWDNLAQKKIGNSFRPASLTRESNAVSEDFVLLGPKDYLPYL